jgi:hypothetical protein
MKNRIITVFVFLASFVSLGTLYAQSPEQSFLKSVALTYNISVDKTGANNQSMGIVVNLFIFPNDDTGYYISPGADLRMKHSESEVENMDI